MAAAFTGNINVSLIDAVKEFYCQTKKCQIYL